MRNLILALILWPSLALAEGLPQPKSSTVNDWAEVISPAVEAELSNRLAAARRHNGVHVVLVTMRDHTDFGGAGESLENYAKRLFNHWGIGDKTRNDGVLILVTPKRRAMRIELGRGYGIDWDDTAKGIIDDTFLPAFREGQIENGIRRGTDQVLDRIAQPFSKGQSPSWAFPGEFFPLIFFAVFAVILGVGNRMGEGIGLLAARFQACPQCGKRQLTVTREIQLEPTENSRGQGMEHTHCRNCRYTHHQSYGIGSISVGSSSSKDRSGGGSSGFGGGRSSGGGASGRW